MPDERILKEMGRYNEELGNAGVMLAGEGLHPGSKGVCVRFSGTIRTVIDGRFSDTKELIPGFWLGRCARKKKPSNGSSAPFNDGAKIELQPVFEAKDFRVQLSP